MPKPNYGSRSSTDWTTREHELRRQKLMDHRNDNKEKRNENVEGDDDSDDSDEEKLDLKGYLVSLGRDILIAVIVMAIIIGSLWGYTGNWPPMVVIESNSMMHGDDSSVGVIDTGDLVLVKEVNSRSEIKTYWEGKKSGYETYGSYGDVIIFRKNGVEETPVIHRAVLWVEYNNSAHNVIRANQIEYNVGGFDIPSKGEYNVTKTWIKNYKPNGINLTIDLSQILINFKKFGREPHSGFLTKGDHNTGIDQTSTLADAKGRPVEPVKVDWVVGKAEGELPWFGLIKLFIGGETSQPGKSAPPTSVNMLILSIVLIVVIPIILDLTFSYLAKRKKKRQERLEEKDHAGGQKPRPRGPESGPVSYTFQPKPRGIEKLEQKTSDQPFSRDRSDIGRDQHKQRDYVSKDDLFKKIK